MKMYFFSLGGSPTTFQPFKKRKILAITTKKWRITGVVNTVVIIFYGRQRQIRPAKALRDAQTSFTRLRGCRMYGNVCLKVNEKGPSRERCCNTPFGAGGVNPPPPAATGSSQGGGSPPHSRSCSNTWPFWAWGGLTPPHVLLKRWGGLTPPKHDSRTWLPCLNRQGCRAWLDKVSMHD